MSAQVDVGVEDRWGHTPLDDAVKKGESALTRYLLVHHHSSLPQISSHATL